MSAFWKYFADKLCWPQSFAPGPLQAIVRGIAGHLDTAREDMPFLREQFFPELCASELVPEHGMSRSLVRHPSETPEQFRQRVVHAYGWHMLGGKTLGLPHILTFYGFEIVAIDNMREYGDSRWAEFDVRLQGSSSVADLNALLASVKTLIWLINEYKPARSILKRIYTDTYDIRPLRPTKGPILSDGFLSYFSGVEDDDLGTDGTVISLGLKMALGSIPFAPVDFCVGVGFQQTLGILAPYIDKFIVGISRIGDKFPQNHGFAFESLYSGFLADADFKGRPWSGPWAASWSAKIGENGNVSHTIRADRKLPAWTFRSRDCSYCQLVPGDGRTLSDDNARLGVSFATTINNPGRVGTMRLGHNPDRQCTRIHQYFTGCSSISTATVNPCPEIPTGIAGTTGFATDNLRNHPHGWHGKWARRRWWPYVALTALRETGLHSEFHAVLYGEVRHATRIPDNLFIAA